MVNKRTVFIDKQFVKDTAKLIGKYVIDHRGECPNTVKLPRIVRCF